MCNLPLHQIDFLFFIHNSFSDMQLRSVGNESAHSTRKCDCVKGCACVCVPVHFPVTVFAHSAFLVLYAVFTAWFLPADSTFSGKMKPRGWLLFSFLLIIQVAYAKIPREYEEVGKWLYTNLFYEYTYFKISENQDNMLFTVTEPYTLAYTYQMKHAFMLGVHFPDGANKTFRVRV